MQFHETELTIQTIYSWDADTLCVYEHIAKDTLAAVTRLACTVLQLQYPRLKGRPNHEATIIPRRPKDIQQL